MAENVSGPVFSGSQEKRNKTSKPADMENPKFPAQKKENRLAFFDITVVKRVKRERHQDRGTIAPAITALDTRRYMQRPSEDIDERDSENPILATSCINELYENFKAQEMLYAVHPYLTKERQPFLTEHMRAMVVNWLVRGIQTVHNCMARIRNAFVLLFRCQCISSFGWFLKLCI